MVEQAVLTKCIEEYKQLEDAERETIRAFLQGSRKQPAFSGQAGPIFFRLADQITALLIDAKGDRSRIEERLQEAGMETEDINLFYPFCHGAATQYLDAMVVNRLKKNNLRQACGFIINRVLLYKDFEHTPFEQFQKLTGLNDPVEAQRMFSFLTVSYTTVLSREMSPQALETKLTLDFGVDRDLVKDIIKPLEDNLSELHMAHISRQLDKIVATLTNE